MTKITEESVRQEFGLTSKSFSTADSTQTTILDPGQFQTFFGKPGRRYLVSITNMDDSFEANRIMAFNLEYGSLIADLSIPPLRNEAVIAQMDEKGIRVYNYSKEGATKRPKVYVSIYAA